MTVITAAVVLATVTSTQVVMFLLWCVCCLICLTEQLLRKLWMSVLTNSSLGLYLLSYFGR